MKPSEQWLRQTPLFEHLSARHCILLAEHALRREYPKGAQIAPSGSVWPYLFLVDQGTIDLVRESSEGRNLIVATLGPGEVFWGLAFFYEEAPSVVTLQAHEAACLSLWHREDLLPILLENGRTSWELCRLMVARMQRASQILGELAFQPVAARVASVLLSHFHGIDGARVKRDLTLDEMAARAGTTREMVCRALYDFASKGLIQITRTEFVLTDMKGLAKLGDRV